MRDASLKTRADRKELFDLVACELLPLPLQGVPNRLANGLPWIDIGLFFTFLCFVSVSTAVLGTFAIDQELLQNEGICYLSFDYTTRCEYMESSLAAPRS